MRGANRRGQLALFVIIAIVIVAILIAVVLYPRLSTTAFSAQNPNDYLTNCIKPELNKTMTVLNSQGGYMDPSGALDYNDKKIKYLCYVPGFYKTCIVQQPMIKNHYEKELADSIKPKVIGCIEGLKEEYQKNGYQVTAGSNDFSVSIVPKKIEFKLNTPLTVAKGDSSQTFGSLKADVPSGMYDILMISDSIVQYEAVYGDSETTLYLMFYPSIKIEKVKLSEGSKVYSVSDVITKEKFTFASRSLSWPPGYGFE